MSYTATFLGGPRDGEVWELPDCRRAVRVPVLMNGDTMSREITYANALEAVSVTVVTIQPVLTANGWVLPWREP